MDDPLISSGRFTGLRYKELALAHRELVASEFYDCQFIRCSLLEAVLRKCRFINCTFQNCDLSLGQFPETVWSGALFEDTKLLGINWTLASWPAAGLGEPLQFVRCALNHATFLGLELREASFLDCTLLNVDFREADLSQAQFAGSDLLGSLFAQTNLTQADFSRARNYQIDPALNILKQAHFSLPEAMALLYSLDIVLDGDL
jgi:fluoroquinolone resistance protein